MFMLQYGTDRIHSHPFGLLGFFKLFRVNTTSVHYCSGHTYLGCVQLSNELGIDYGRMDMGGTSVKSESSHFILCIIQSSQ